MKKIKPFNSPNFFILGAAKSGTTSLYHYLKQHPLVYMSSEKEPTFFCEDFQVVKNPIKYFELYDNVTQERLIGEASHGYLTDPKVPRLLKTLFPDAKFIITLRNPADRAYSLYQHMRRYRFEKIGTFEKALLEEEKRYISKHFKSNNPQYFYNYLYYKSGLYGEQIERYFSLFDRNQFHILTLSDIKGNFKETMDKIWTFLELEPITDLSPEIHNKGYVTSSHYLDKLLNNRIVSQFGVQEKLGTLTRSNLKKIDPKTKKELMMKFELDQKLLYRLTGIRFD